MVPVTLLQRAALALLPLSLLAACTTPAGQQQPASDLLPASYAHSAQRWRFCCRYPER